MSRPIALIIDDEPDLCELLGITLARMKVDSESVHDLESARRTLQRSQFDLCLLNVWHCLESDVVTNPQDHPRFQVVFVGRTPSVTARALRDVVIAFGAMEDFSTTSSSATQLQLSKVCVNRRKRRLVLNDRA